MEPSGDSELLATLQEASAPAAEACADLEQADRDISLTPHSPSPTPSVAATSCEAEGGPRTPPTATPEPPEPPASPRDGELAVQRELRAGGLDHLLKKYPLKAKRHQQHPELVCLRYLVNNKFELPVMRECRGIILNEKENWDVVSMSFRKFMNHGERYADEIDWGRARVYEKLDGSLMSLYHYKGRWHVSSSAIPDAAGPCGTEKFSEVFWDIWKKMDYRLPEQTGYTYCFEMLSDRNRVVCPVAKDRIVLLGARRLADLTEEPAEAHAQRSGWELAKSYPLGSLKEVQAAVDAMNCDGVDEEGFVVCDMGNFQRVKVKSPKYVMMSHLHGIRTGKEPSDKQLFSVVQNDEVSEVLVHFPHLERRLRRMESGFKAIAEELASNTGRGFPKLRQRYADTVPTEEQGSPTAAALWLRRAVDRAALLKLIATYLRHIDDAEKYRAFREGKGKGEAAAAPAAEAASAPDAPAAAAAD